MVIRSADSQGLLLHTPPPMLSGIPTPTHTISYAVQNYQTLEQFLESLYAGGERGRVSLEKRVRCNSFEHCVQSFYI